MPLDDAPEFAPNPRAVIAHNAPPAAQSIEAARETYASISDFLKSAVVIQDEETAKQAKLMLDRGAAAVADLEKDLETAATPLRKIWMDCRARFTPAIDSFVKPIAELKARMRVYALAEEQKRNAILAEARRKEDELRAAALEAERLEREAKENASLGDCEADVGAAIQQADESFAAFELAGREAARAAREAADTTIRGGFARGVGLKTVKTPVIVDAAKVLAAVGATDGVKAALLTAARSFKKLHGKWPDGVEELEERKI